MTQTKKTDPALSDLLLPEQISQMRRMLAELAGQGFGRLEIVVERGRIRRLCPVRLVRRPGPPGRFSISDGGDVWDEWQGELSAGLVDVMAAGWGMVCIAIEHGRVIGVDIAPSIPAAGFDTGRVASCA